MRKQLIPIDWLENSPTDNSEPRDPCNVTQDTIQSPQPKAPSEFCKQHNEPLVAMHQDKLLCNMCVAASDLPRSELVFMALMAREVQTKFQRSLHSFKAQEAPKFDLEQLKAEYIQQTRKVFDQVRANLTRMKFEAKQRVFSSKAMASYNQLFGAYEDLFKVPQDVEAWKASLDDLYKRGRYVRVIRRKDKIANMCKQIDQDLDDAAHVQVKTAALLAKALTIDTAGLD
jgi:virulence-associated protein VapD